MGVQCAAFFPFAVLEVNFSFRQQLQPMVLGCPFLSCERGFPEMNLHALQKCIEMDKNGDTEERLDTFLFFPEKAAH